VEKGRDALSALTAKAANAKATESALKN